MANFPHLTPHAIPENIFLKYLNPQFGALVSFIGVVREKGATGPVVSITYHALESMAEKRLQHIEDAIKEKHRLPFCLILHRIGKIPIGEASVVILCASPHRKEAFQACQEALERIKREVPIWKEEHHPDGSSEFVPGCPLDSPL